MTPPDPLIGALFDGRYKILKRLGSGGMATVYVAEDQELGRRVAIKILNSKHASDEQFVERFRREASSAASLSHSNIVQIYDRGNAEGTYYIAMELIEGRTLKELLIERGPSPIPVAVNYARQILAALRFAHRNGVVHRDIKPHNVLVDEEGRVKVADFGIARAGASEMTEVGSIIGTAQYLSPEQARGAPVDASSDLYSVGVVLYELLTGEAPYNGDTPVEIAMKHLSAIPEPPSTKRPDVPPELDQVVLRALAKNPDDRYQNAEEMDADLIAVSRGEGISGETAEAATTVLAGAGLSAPTMISRAPTRVVSPPAATGGLPPSTPSYYDFDEPRRRRPIWPWLLSLALVAAVAVAFWIVYEQLSANNPVAVPLVTEIREDLAVEKIQDAGLDAKTIQQASDDVRPGYVIRQTPKEGERVSRGSEVTIWVSSGSEKVRVPSVIGMSGYEAINKLHNAGFEVVTKRQFNDAKADTVFNQDPQPSENQPKGSTITIWISRGPEPVPVPSVIGYTYKGAVEKLQGTGFEVSREDVESDKPVGSVVDQDPAAGSEQPPGTVINLSVSSGPGTVSVPNVTGEFLEDARAQLTADGFDVTVVEQETTDVSQDGIVISQLPGAGTEADHGSTIELTVGVYVEPPA